MTKKKKKTTLTTGIKTNNGKKNWNKSRSKKILMQQIVYLEIDYDSFIVLCESIKITAQILKPIFICILLIQPLQFYSPEIKKFFRKKTHKKKEFRGLT